MQLYNNTGSILYIFLNSILFSQAHLLHHAMPFPTSMKPVSFWNGPFPRRQAAERMCATISYADRFCRIVGGWRSVAQTYAFCHAESACQTPQWWLLTCSRTPTTASFWRPSTGCQSWPKTMLSSTWHLTSPPIRQVCCAFLILLAILKPCPPIGVFLY